MPGPALSIGAAALADRAWIDGTRMTLRTATERLETLLSAAGLTPVGRTDLFCLVSSPRAQEIFTTLGEAGIFVRRFDENPQLLRFGLPGKEIEWQRLSGALKSPS